MSVSTRTKSSQLFSLETLAAYHELTKPGITMLVLASMIMGYIMGSAGSIDYITLINAILGTYLIAAGTAAHNQFIERNYDKLMKRTQDRPLPSSKISPAQGFVFSIALIIAGLVYLIAMVNFVAAAVSAVTTFTYLAVYTPMKRHSVANVFIGSIPGALPPVGGWAAATGSIADPGMWILFGIVYLWQVPHVMAIAWLCNDDYSNAGFQMLPLGDHDGKVTALMVNICLLTLIPVTYLFYSLGYAHLIYLIGGILSALYFIYYGLKFWTERSKDHAKKLMFASFFYLPLVWIFIFVDLIVHSYIL
jgi:protoheme IX farnesyltransferase